MTNAPYAPKLRLGKTLGDAVKKATKPAFKKRSQIEHRLFTEWKDVVGEDLASKTLPEKMLKRQGMLWLQLRVHPAFALTLQHQEPLILERIGRFFGYNTIQRVTLRHDASLAALPSKPSGALGLPLLNPTDKAEEMEIPLPIETAETIDKVEDSALSDALRKLARHISTD